MLYSSKISIRQSKTNYVYRTQLAFQNINFENETYISLKPDAKNLGQKMPDLSGSKEKKIFEMDTAIVGPSLAYGGTSSA